VPAVVHTTSTMIAHMATLGPDIQSHRDSPPTVVSASADGGASLFTPKAPRARWTMPRGSANQAGPSTPTFASRALTTPLEEKMNRKTTEIATELVTDGK
jgi:hypothetical protein